VLILLLSDLASLPQLPTTVVTNWVAIGIVIALLVVLVIGAVVIGIYIYFKRKRRAGMEHH